MLISLTVGKVDAGVAVLLTEDKRLIEFPSILLPDSITSGSIVDINVASNPGLEAVNAKAFAKLQQDILETYGLQSPKPPVLRCRNITQTAIVLEWDQLELATAELRSLALYRNGAKVGVIPRIGRDGEPVLATKISGLAVDTDYKFHLRLVTSAGSYVSSQLECRTHRMTNLTGITVTPGPLPAPLRNSLTAAVERIGARLVEGVRIDTTHFVCTEGRGREWEKAGEMNIPIVRPEWVEGCEHEGRIVGVRGYYLGADPKLRQVGPGTASRVVASEPQQNTHSEAQSQKELPIRQAVSSEAGNTEPPRGAEPPSSRPPSSGPSDPGHRMNDATDQETTDGDLHSTSSAGNRDNEYIDGEVAKGKERAHTQTEEDADTPMRSEQGSFSEVQL